MNQRQQNLRYAAARAFIESLDQLQETLQPSEAQPLAPIAPEKDNYKSAKISPSDPFDLSSFEQAVADIEEFIQKRQQGGEVGK
ncbi:MAG: hypothetical protein KME45_04445 [Stenomitos rutilans HA7619-LM2]|jgi:hypothetical protein|nr:hypothetical protein [Stenomitos rutilans HA7619-LM2]